MKIFFQTLMLKIFNIKKTKQNKTKQQKTNKKKKPQTTHHILAAKHIVKI